MKLLLIFLGLISFQLHATERDYQEHWCKKYGGVIEYRLPDRTRVDCLTDKLAIEFDFAPKWADGFGQAVWYGLATGRRGAIALITADDEYHHVYRLERMIAQQPACNRIELIIIPLDSLISE